MPRKKSRKKKEKCKKVGIEAVVEPGVGTLYVRSTWINDKLTLGYSKYR